jgi:TPP-dependent pyruvate/acetoin dehydrogenase alpha subunit
MPNASRRKSATPSAAAYENPLVPHAKLKQLYVLMLKSRMLAERMVRDARQRRTDRRIGHEASRVAIALGLRPGDIAVPAPADHVVPVAIGTSIRAVARGTNGSTRDAVQLLPAFARDTNQFAFACGLAVAKREASVAQLKKSKTRKRQSEQEQNVVVVFGDEVSRETLTYAAEQKLPMIFVVENSAPVDIAGHASTRGVTGFTVDGNDAVGVYRVAQECLDRARRGVGPSFIECKAPAWKGRMRFERAAHRDIHELDDPLTYVEHYMAARGLFTDEWKKSLKSAIAKELQEAFATARTTKKQLSPLLSNI